MRVCSHAEPRGAVVGLSDLGLRALTDLIVAAIGEQHRAALDAACGDVLAAADQAALTAAAGRFTALVASLAGPSGRAGLLLAALGGAVPDLPGLRAALLSALATPPAGGVQPHVPLGVVDVGMDLQAALVVPDFPGGLPLAFGLLPPSGLALAVGGGPVQGSGSLSYRTAPTRRFSGSLGLRAGPVTVSGYALLEAPDAGGVSVVVLLGAHFTPGLQLGFGFALGGVGGLVGVNRRMDVDRLRLALADGSATRTLFPGDPARDAPDVLRHLDEFFPRQQGSFVAGPTLELTFLEALARLDIAVLLELPAARVVVLGRGLVQLPPGVPLVQLRADVMGEVDPPRRLTAVTAVLVDSRALGVFRVTGGATLQQSWGSTPYTVLSVGGFYPGFDPSPAVVPHLDRVGLEPDLPLPGGFRVRAAGYLAITSNTVQAGIDLAVGIDAVVLSATATLKVDAICQFRPFHFHVDFSAGVEVDATLFSGGATIRGWIDGPGPLRIHGSISVDLLIDDLEWSDTFTIGASVAQDPGAAPQDVAAAVAATVVGQNLRASGGADAEVVLTPGPTDGVVPLLLPRGTVSWQQQLTPLATPVQRFQGVPLAGAGPNPPPVLVQAVPAPGTPWVPDAAPRDWFAPGLYLDRTGSEALDLPPYDLLPSGVAVRMPLQRSAATTADADHREVYRGLQAQPDTGWAALLGLFLQRADGRGHPPVVRDRTPLVVARQETWAVRDHGPARPADSRTAAFADARQSPASTALPLTDAAIDVTGLVQ